MLRIDVDLVPTRHDLDVAVVIDVLRMTTTAAAMLAHGHERVSIVADVAGARELAARTRARLFGERHGVALPGFDGGNSPLEHTADAAPAVPHAVLCTTNGSRAVEHVATARHVLLGAIVNAHAVAQRAHGLATTAITLVCAGTDDAPSLDDALGAGLIVRELRSLAGGADLLLSDTGQMALDVAAATPDPLEGLRRAAHARTLIALGFERDVAYAAHVDRLRVVPERHTVRPASFGAAPATSGGTPATSGAAPPA
jgi:2-phosphosulfolactate phosphatase